MNKSIWVHIGRATVRSLAVVRMFTRLDRYGLIFGDIFVPWRQRASGQQESGCLGAGDR